MNPYHPPIATLDDEPVWPGWVLAVVLAPLWLPVALVVALVIIGFVVFELTMSVFESLSRSARRVMPPVLLVLLLPGLVLAQRVPIQHSVNYGAIVRVECNLQENRMTSGSGILLDSQHCLTANHCVRAGSLLVLLPGQKVPADVIAVHPQNDWALLRFRQPLIGVPPVRVRARALNQGETVYGYGFGRVGQFGYTRATYQGYHVTGCLIEEGDSGGPVLDSQGYLCGLVTEYDSGTCNWRGHALATDAFRSFCELRYRDFDNVLMVD